MSVPRLPSCIPPRLRVIIWYLLAVGAAVIAALIVCEVAGRIG